MKSIKLLIYKIFGLKTYLQIVSRIYIFLTTLGYGKKKYPEIHRLKELIKPGYNCLDIGANLGYYSFFLSKYAGKEGKVFSVEPIPLFGEIWKKNVARTKMNNLELLPYALGAEEKKVQMGMPTVEGTVHHGMTKVIDSKENIYEKTFDVTMQIPDKLFLNLPKINFLKIDIEGYEHIALANMKEFLNRDKPMIQAELGGEENRKASIKILQEIGYKIFIVKNSRFCETSLEESLSIKEDLYFKNE